ncbi:unnamed protein product [Prorocentrum cordatum]|uniref:Uncharacterized protein n=1 Tax=Prorocentrum cordatum TaxID=2364126 RepID=A0ABN9PBB8_9DINO|nr:unnamed protein product [Polarella glacialis]
MFANQEGKVAVNSPIGACKKQHSEAMRERLKSDRDYRRYRRQYLGELQAALRRLVEDSNTKARRTRQKLLAGASCTAETTEAVDGHITAREMLVSEKVQAAEKMAEDGDMDASRDTMREAEDLAHEKYRLARLKGAGKGSRPVLDAAFIDDEALAIVARRPKDLDVAIDALLGTVLEVFECLHLQLNAAPGKTECTHVSLRSVSLANVKHRSSSTMRAYVPLAWKLYGSARVLEAHKLIFARTLFFTSLFFGLHVLVLAPALESHQRAKHGVRLDIQDFLANATCPACSELNEKIQNLASVVDGPTTTAKDLGDSAGRFGGRVEQGARGPAATGAATAANRRAYSEAPAAGRRPRNGELTWNGGIAAEAWIRPRVLDALPGDIRDRVNLRPRPGTVDISDVLLFYAMKTFSPGGAGEKAEATFDGDRPLDWTAGPLRARFTREALFLAPRIHAHSIRHMASAGADGAPGAKAVTPAAAGVFRAVFDQKQPRSQITHLVDDVGKKRVQSIHYHTCARSAPAASNTCTFAEPVALPPRRSALKRRSSDARGSHVSSLRGRSLQEAAVGSPQFGLGGVSGRGQCPAHLLKDLRWPTRQMITLQTIFEKVMGGRRLPPRKWQQLQDDQLFEDCSSDSSDHDGFATICPDSADEREHDFDDSKHIEHHNEQTDDFQNSMEADLAREEFDELPRKVEHALGQSGFGRARVNCQALRDCGLQRASALVRFVVMIT